MRTKQVRWFEGMLVLPHHFQAAEANYLDLLATSQDWLAPYAYGIRAIDINLDALANFEVRIPRLQARLKDGSLISVPQNGFLQTLDLRPAFAAHAELYVHLRFRMSSRAVRTPRPQWDADGAPLSRRYSGMGRTESGKCEPGDRSARS